MKDQRMKNYLMPVKLWKKEKKTRKMQRASSMRGDDDQGGEDQANAQVEEEPTEIATST